jgi:1-acyl-sn-glycerol-3-phosphate acyltransferase
MRALTHVRATVRLVLILLVAFVAAVLLLLASALLMPFPRARSRVGTSILDLTVAAGCRLTGMRITVVGAPPKPPFLLVANHLGYLDILLTRQTTKTRFISKAEVAQWPLFGALARMTGTLFLERRNKRDLTRINGMLDEVWQQGSGITVFPEGTSTSGRGVAPFHAGLLAFPAETARPVHTATIHYETTGGPPAAEALCWWGDMTFLDHLYGLLRMRHFQARITFAPLPLTHPARKDLAAALREQVLQSFQPVEGAPAA